MPFGYSLAFIVDRLFSFYSWLIIIYVLMSWFPIRGGILLDIYRVLGSICEPFVSLFRRLLPTAAVGGAGLDFSPLVAILVLNVVKMVVVNILVRAGL